MIHFTVKAFPSNFRLAMVSNLSSSLTNRELHNWTLNVSSLKKILSSYCWHKKVHVSALSETQHDFGASALTENNK